MTVRLLAIACLVAILATPVAAQSLSKTSLAFGSQVVTETSAAKTINFRNTLLIPVTLQSVSVGGTNATDFVATSSCVLPRVVAPGKYCTFSVRFTPPVLGPRTASLSFAHDQPGSPLTAPLTGTGVVPVTLSPTSLSFGSVVLGKTSTSKSVTLKNVQKAQLSVTALVVPAPFVRTGGTCPAGTGTMAGATSCTILVAYAPKSAGSAAATLTVTHSASNSPQSVALSGKGVAPITVSPTSLSFGSRTLGTTSSPKTVTITNTSGAVLALGEMSMFGDYAVSSTTCGTSLAAGARCTIAITFTPAYVVGVRLGTLSVVHGAFGSPLRIALSGTATGDALLSLEVTPANPVIGLGHGQQFTATAHYTDGTSADVTDAVFWNSGFPMRGRITTDGLYTVFASGTNPVTAQLGSRSGTTTPTGASLTVSRAWGATATVLLDGRVLIAGGLLSEATTAVELYDPVAGTFTPAASMTTAREAHTATRLNDGRVLVVGGFGPSGALKSAEIFDPAAGTWTPTGSPVVKRGGHTASLVGTKVLVAGGINGTPLAFAELFDPATNAWVPTGSLNVARSAHAAATLADGRVLVTGGMNTSFNAIATAEIYNPAGGFWTATASMSTVRELHTATTVTNGDVLVVGGATGSSALASAELFHPASGTWSPTAALPVPAYDHTATRLPSGQVLVTGGTGAGNDNSFATLATLYDALGSTVSVTPRLAYHRYSHSAVALNDGRVLLLGGYYWGTTAEILNPDATPVFVSAFPFTRTAAIGETVTFTAQVQFSDDSYSYATESAAWSVSPESVATVVGPGSIKALGPGTATVTVTVGTLKALATLQVP